MRIVKGDILNSTEPVILHQVNCKGVMGAGLAKKIRDKYPKVYKSYKEICKIKIGTFILGKIQIVAVEDKKFIINLFAQLNYGRGVCFTDYNALRSCLFLVKKHTPRNSIAIPYGLGCGLAGGDWIKVIEIIEEVFEGSDIEVVIYKLED